MVNIISPDSEEYRAIQEAQMTPYEKALKDREYIPGIISWLVGVRRSMFHDAMIAKGAENPKWADNATADMAKNSYFEQAALTEVRALDIEVPSDDIDFRPLRV